MFLSLEFPIVISIIAVIVVQYGFAVFCLVKLAYIDLPRKTYILWNVFILLAFFVGGIVFLIYYARVGKHKKISPYESQVVSTDDAPTMSAKEIIDMALREDAKDKDAQDPVFEEQNAEPENNTIDDNTDAE